MLIAAMNPCPCGNFGSRTRECRCSPSQIQRYTGRVSGPILDRIDIHVEMLDVSHEELTSAETGESSAAIRARVNKARAIQYERYKNDGIYMNAQLSGALMRKYCVMDDGAAAMMKKAAAKLNLSARAMNRVTKVARTIADIAGRDTICAADIAEAVQYRSMDDKYWGSR